MKLFHPQYSFLRWDYWFGQVDSRPLSLFRICFAALLLKNALYLTLLAHRLYSDAGIMPRALLWDGPPRPYHFSFMDFLSQDWMAVLFFLLWAAVAAMLLFGYHTRMMAVLNLVLILSVQERNPYVLTGANVVMRVLSFWMLFLPLDHYYSIDAVRRRWARYRQTRHLSDLRVSDIPHTTYAFPLRMIQIQIALIYLLTSYVKIKNGTWLTGDALHYAFQMHAYLLPSGEWLRSLTPDWLLHLFTWFTLFIEMAFVPLIFSPLAQPFTRATGLVLAALLHLGIALTMSIPDFSVVMWISYVLFFAPEWVCWLEQQLRLRRGQSLVKLPNLGSPVWLILSLTRLKQITTTSYIASPHQEEAVEEILDERGQLHIGLDAQRWLLGYLLSSRLWGWALRWGRLPGGVWTFLQRIVQAVHLPAPQCIGEVEMILPSKPHPRVASTLRLGLTAILVVAMGVVIWGSVESAGDDFDPVIPPMPEPFRTAIAQLHLAHSWGMFSYESMHHAGWIVIYGQFEDGTHTDLYDGTRDRAFWGPAVAQRDFDQSVALYRFSPILRAWGRYYCQQYNVAEARPVGLRLARLEIHFLFRRTYRLGDAPRPLQDDLLWTHRCY